MLTVAFDGWKDTVSKHKILNFNAVDGHDAFFWESHDAEFEKMDAIYLSNRLCSTIDDIEAKGGIVVCLSGDNEGKYRSH